MKHTKGAPPDGGGNDAKTDRIADRAVRATRERQLREGEAEADLGAFPTMRVIGTRKECYADFILRPALKNLVPI
jgi:hypothetical protein